MVSPATDMLGVSGQITTGALTRRTAGGGAGCRNLHRGMRLAKWWGFTRCVTVAGALRNGMESMAAILRQFTGHNLHLSPPYTHLEWG